MKKKFIVLLVSFVSIGPIQATVFAEGCCGPTLQAINGVNVNVQSAHAATRGTILTSGKMIQETIVGVANAYKDMHMAAIGQVQDEAMNQQIALINNQEANKAGRRARLTYLNCEGATSGAAAMIAKDYSEKASGMAQASWTTRNRVIPHDNYAIFDTYNDHIEKYCGEADELVGACNKTTMPDADVNIDSLLMGAGKPGKGTDYTFSDEQLEAAQRFVSNAINARPSSRLPQEAEKTVEGKKYLAMQLEEQAQLSVAMKPYMDSLARKAPVEIDGEDFGEYVISIWEKMAQSGAKIPEDLVTDLVTKKKKASFWFFINTEVNRRFANPGWYEDLAQNTSMESLAKEALMMDALALNLKIMELNSLEKIELLLGQLLASDVRSPYRVQQIKQQFKAAGEAARQKAH